MCALRGVLLKAVRGGGDPYILLFSTQGGGVDCWGGGDCGGHPSPLRLTDLLCEEVVLLANQPLGASCWSNERPGTGRGAAAQCIPPLREGVTAERGPHMGGSLPLATQSHGEGGWRGRMDATTGNPWRPRLEINKAMQLEYEVTKAAAQLEDHITRRG